MNLLLRFTKRELASYRIGVLSGARMLCTVGNVLRRIINHVKALLTDCFKRLAEPVDVKCAVIQLLGRNRRILGEQCFLLVGEPLVHMRDKVIAGRFKAFPSEILSDNGNPGIRIKRCLHKAFIRDVGALNQCAELLRVVSFTRYTYRQQMRKTATFGHLRAVSARALYRITSECAKDLYEAVRAEDTADFSDCHRKFSR